MRNPSWNPHRGTRQARIIREVIKADRRGKPKVARDRRAGLHMERIIAHVEHPCESERCAVLSGPVESMYPNVIEAGTEYAKVTNMSLFRYMGGQRIPEVRNYHFECVPEEAYPLVRFFRG